MRKIGLYSLLAAAILISGCSKKSSEMVVDNGNQTPVIVEESSETALNAIPETNIDVADGTFSGEERVDNGVYYTINGKRVLIENIYFAFDRYNLSGINKDRALSNAQKLSQLNSNSTVKVSGNTDEWGTDEYNYALGLKRAKTVKDVLERNGVSANVTLISYGESNPVCRQNNSSCWAKNRRVEHTLIK